MLDLNLFANHIRHRNTFGVVDGLALLPLDRVANFLGLVLANLPRLHPAQIIRYIYVPASEIHIGYYPEVYSTNIK